MRSEITKAYRLLESGVPGRVEEALELLQNTVFSFSMTVCGHREDAEDTMQEVLLKAIPYLGRFDSPKALTTWLFKVARNRCWMSRRRSKFAPREHLSLEDLLPDAAELDRLGTAGGPSPEKTAIAAQDAEQLQQAILKVPPAYRLVLVLHDIEELSTDEIARILNLQRGTVRVRLHRARLFLRREFSQTGQMALDSNAHLRTPNAKRTKRACSPDCKRIFANLSDYLDGALDQSLCHELERHMAGCKPCKAFLASLRNSIATTHSLPRQLADPNVGAEARAQCARELRSSNR